MKILISVLVLLSLTAGFSASGACTKDQAKAAVLKMCDLIAQKSEGALTDIGAYRYCEDNYVWIQDGDVKMVLHPIKRRLNGNDLTKHKDEDGKLLFIEFDKMAKSNPEGGWVDYVWAKTGAEKATPKTSFVKLCPGPKKWIAGSGIWK